MHDPLLYLLNIWKKLFTDSLTTWNQEMIAHFKRASCIIHIALIVKSNLLKDLLPRKSHWLKDWLAGRSRTNKGQNRCGIILISSPSLSTISCQHPLDFSANSKPLLSTANRFKGSLLSVRLSFTAFRLWQDVSSHSAKENYMPLEKYRTQYSNFT